MKTPEHPIFLQSIAYINSQIGSTGLHGVHQSILERIIHSSGDLGLQPFLKVSTGACDSAISALRNGATIVTDTYMAAAAVSPIAKRTLNSEVKCILDMAPETIDSLSTTKSAIGMRNVWLGMKGKDQLFKAPIVVIGSAPTALMTLLDLIENGNNMPSLIIGMPVGFIGVAESKKRLLRSDCPYIVLEGSRGGASLAAATINALLIASDNLG